MKSSENDEEDTFYDAIQDNFELDVEIQHS